MLLPATTTPPGLLSPCLGSCQGFGCKSLSSTVPRSRNGVAGIVWQSIFFSFKAYTQSCWKSLQPPGLWAAGLPKVMGSIFFFEMPLTNAENLAPESRPRAGYNPPPAPHSWSDHNWQAIPPPVTVRALIASASRETRITAGGLQRRSDLEPTARSEELLQLIHIARSTREDPLLKSRWTFPWPEEVTTRNTCFENPPGRPSAASLSGSVLATVHMLQNHPVKCWGAGSTTRLSGVGPENLHF